MIKRCRGKTFPRILGLGAILALVFKTSSLLAQPEAESPEKPEATVDEKGPELTDAKTQALPTIDELMSAKINALEQKLTEQKELLAQANLDLENEQAIESNAFQSGAYLSLSIANSAPLADYRLLSTKVYLDDRLIAEGGKRNLGMPYLDQIFLGRVSPGCHDVRVTASYMRLKKGLFGKFRDVNRIEEVSAAQAFVAKEGHSVAMKIEGFEKQNTILSFFRGLAFRFNNSTWPNFLPGTSIGSLDEINKLGRVKVDYVTESSSLYHLLQKNISIDGFPILQSLSSDETKQDSLVFDGPLAEGRHRLHVTLLFGEKKWIGGGPNYNLRFQFERDFAVISGQTTLVHLAGLPKNGFRSTPEDSRYARVTTQIVSLQEPDVFPQKVCKEFEKTEARKVKKKVKPKEAGEAAKPTESKSEELTVEPMPIGQGE